MRTGCFLSYPFSFISNEYGFDYNFIYIVNNIPYL